MSSLKSHPLDSIYAFFPPRGIKLKKEKVRVVSAGRRIFFGPAAGSWISLQCVSAVAHGVQTMLTEQSAWDTPDWLVALWFDSEAMSVAQSNRQLAGTSCRKGNVRWFAGYVGGNPDEGGTGGNTCRAQVMKEPAAVCLMTATRPVSFPLLFQLLKSNWILCFPLPAQLCHFNFLVLFLKFSILLRCDLHK